MMPREPCTSTPASDAAALAARSSVKRTIRRFFATAIAARSPASSSSVPTWVSSASTSSYVTSDSPSGTPPASISPVDRLWNEEGIERREQVERIDLSEVDERSRVRDCCERHAFRPQSTSSSTAFRSRSARSTFVRPTRSIAASRSRSPSRYCARTRSSHRASRPRSVPARIPRTRGGPEPPRFLELGRKCRRPYCAIVRLCS